ncbi:MAG: hypothetical protein HY902_12495 [Deltaproteobacteria bacterium]|nr:hypothetical protein [Deltaproteobacteria bacterium]
MNGFKTIVLAATSLLAACAGPIQFERAVGTGKYPPLPMTAPIELAKRVSDLPPPTTVLGQLRLRPTHQSSPQGKAEEDLLDAAGHYGCDAIAVVEEIRVDAKGQKNKEGPDYQWVAACVRTGKAEVVALAAGARPEGSPAERERQRLLSEAEQARKEAERASSRAEDKERQAQLALEAAEKDRQRQAVAAAELEKKHKEAEEERRRREAEQAEREKKRKEAEATDKAKKENEARLKKEAEAAEKERKKQQAAEEKARKEAEAKQKKQAEADEKARKEAEAKRKKEGDAAQKARADAEAKQKREAETQKQASEKAKRDGEAQKLAAERAKKDAEAAEKAKKEAEAADRAKRDAEAKRAEEAKRAADAERAKKEAEDRQREAEKAEAEEKARAEAEEKARREPEGKKGKQKVVDWRPRYEAAQRDGGEAAWLEALGVMPDGDEADKGYEALQKAAKAHANAWLQLEPAQLAADEVDIAAPLDAAQVKKDLGEADATTARFLAPREVIIPWVLKNPTKQPVVVEVHAGPQHMSRALEPGGQASGSWRTACSPLGPPLRSKVGLVLQYRYSCDLAKTGAHLASVRPARRELAVDKRAVDSETSPEALAKVWSAVPNTRLADLQLLALNEGFRKRAEDLSVLTSKVTAEKLVPGQPVSIKVELRSTANRDVTAVFDVGGGRDERLLVPKRGLAEVRLVVPAGAPTDVRIKGLLPKLRAADWLVGDWVFQGVHLVILPTDKGLMAFALEPGAGEDVPPRLWPMAVDVGSSDATWQGELPGLFALALLADKTPAACESRCSVQMRARFIDQDQYILGAGRVLILDVQVADRKGSFKLAADY